MLKNKHISKFTLLVICVIVIVFLLFWARKFGLYLPIKGTSTASISALWGQFIISLLIIVVISSALFIADLREKPTPIYKLASLYVLALGIIVPIGLYVHSKIEYGTAHTYKSGQEFSYMQYKFTVTPTLQTIKSEDCTNLSSVNPPSIFSNIPGLTDDRPEPSPKQNCENFNSNTAGHRFETVTITASNTKPISSFFTPDWFKAVDANGNVYKLNFLSTWDAIIYQGDGLSVNTEPLVFHVPANGQIKTNLVLSNSSGAQLLDANETITSITVKIDNHAQQIVKVN